MSQAVQLGRGGKAPRTCRRDTRRRPRGANIRPGSSCSCFPYPCRNPPIFTMSRGKKKTRKPGWEPSIQAEMKTTPVQQAFNGIAAIVQGAVNTAGQQGRRQDEKDLCNAYRLWRQRALARLQDYPEGKRSLRWSQVLGGKVLAQLQSLRVSLEKQDADTVDTRILLDLLVSYSPQIDSRLPQLLSDLVCFLLLQGINSAINVELWNRVREAINAVGGSAVGVRLFHTPFRSISLGPYLTTLSAQIIGWALKLPWVHPYVSGAPPAGLASGSSSAESAPAQEPGQGGAPSTRRRSSIGHFLLGRFSHRQRAIYGLV